jgi:hypothetical protein
MENRLEIIYRISKLITNGYPLLYDIKGKYWLGIFKVEIADKIKIEKDPIKFFNTLKNKFNNLNEKSENNNNLSQSHSETYWAIEGIIQIIYAVTNNNDFDTRIYNEKTLLFRLDTFFIKLDINDDLLGQLLDNINYDTICEEIGK